MRKFTLSLLFAFGAFHGAAVAAAAVAVASELDIFRRSTAPA